MARPAFNTRRNLPSGRMQYGNVASAIDLDYARGLHLAVGGRGRIYPVYIYPRTIIGTSGLYFDDRAVAGYRSFYLEVCRSSSPSSSYGLMTTWLESPGSLPSCLDITPLLPKSKRKVIASHVSGEDAIYQLVLPSPLLWGSCHVESWDVLTSPRPQQEEIRTLTTQATPRIGMPCGLHESQPQCDSAWLNLQGFES